MEAIAAIRCKAMSERLSARMKPRASIRAAFSPSIGAATTFGLSLLADVRQAWKIG
jgi:hypothetical protein